MQSEKLLEWLYCGASVVKSTDHANHLEFTFFEDCQRPLQVVMPLILLRSHHDDPLCAVRLAITGGDSMDIIQNVYHPDAVYAGHTFGTFVEDGGRNIFRLVSKSEQATHLYREVIWRRSANAERRAPQMLQSQIADYLHTVEITQEGISSGVDITVCAIRQGVEHLADSYFKRMYYFISGVAFCDVAY